jgi:hypothetical protein
MQRFSMLRLSGNYKFLNQGMKFYSLLTTLLIGLFAVELYLFSNVQDIWLDETTQLSGIRLNLFDMLRWLIGADVAHLGVPDDRMPPLSYILDWSWLHLSGSSEVGFRLFHAVFVLGGVAGLAALTWRVLGPPPTIILLGFMVLSPKLIQTGVELRAYPLFFAVTCAQVAVFLRVVDNANNRNIWPLALFSLLCLVAIYTHFFGVVSFGAFAVALAISSIGRRSEHNGAALIFGVMCIVGAIGILPFVLTAIKNSGSIVPDHKDGERIIKFVNYFFKLFADSANMVSLTAAALFFAGILTLFAAGVVGFYFRMRKHCLESTDWLLTALISGVFVTVMTSFFVSSFDTLKVGYSIWTFPLLSIIIASGWRFWAGYRLWWDIGRKLAAGALMAGAASSTYVLLSHSAEFVHGPREFVISLYDKAAAPKAIVYEPGADWGFAYFPLFFSSGGLINQYLSVGKNLEVIESGGAIKHDADGIDTRFPSYRFIFLVDLKLRTYADIRRCNDNIKACPQFTSSEVYKILNDSGQWSERGTERKFGLYDTQVRILEKVGDAPN